MQTADNPATEPVLSDLLYKDATPSVEEADDSQSEAETTDEEVGDDAESAEAESESEESDETETDDDAEPEEYEVVVDGEKLKVNRKELVDGYQRQSDYTRKTEAVAKERKAVEAQKAQADEALKVLSDITAEIESLVMGDVKNIDWDAVRTSDPSEYLRLKEVEAAKKHAVGSLVEKRNKLIQERTTAESAELHRSLGWSDAKKKQADIDLITGFMQEQGITDQVTSHKLMLAIHDAAKYQQLQKTKVETLKEIKKAPKTTKPVKTPKPSGPKLLEDLLYK